MNSAVMDARDHCPRTLDRLDAAQVGRGPLHLAVGVFDGVHLGHRAVIEPAVQSARRCSGTAGVLTFSPHPSVVLRPQQPTRLIMDPAARAKLMGRLGVEVVIALPFTTEFAQMEATEFLPWLKRSLPTLAGVYVGANWRFGRGRNGDVALLVKEGRALGIDVFSAPPVSLNGEPISSSRIRTALAAGDVADASRMLGYVYFADGEVRSGKKLGRTLGFPTLNISWAPELRPAFGVYVVTVRGAKSEKPLAGVANYGLRPTVEQTVQPKLEVHVLGECPYDAGDVVTVEWLDFVRPEKKFGSMEELRQQIGRDRDAAAAWFAR